MENQDSNYTVSINTVFAISKEGVWLRKEGV